jgi:hypothetical protein
MYLQACKHCLSYKSVDLRSELHFKSLWWHNYVYCARAQRTRIAAYTDCNVHAAHEHSMHEYAFELDEIHLYLTTALLPIVHRALSENSLSPYILALFMLQCL